MAAATFSVFGSAPVSPTFRALAAATLVSTIVGALLPPEAAAVLLHPNPAYPWSLVLATLAQPDPFLLCITIGVLWVAGPFFGGMFDKRFFLGLYFSSGAVGHLVTSAVLTHAMGQWTPAVGRGAIFALCSLGVGYAHYNGRQRVSLYNGMIDLELRQAVLLVVLFEAYRGWQFGAAGADAAGRAAAVLLAWASFNFEELKAALQQGR